MSSLPPRHPGVFHKECVISAFVGFPLVMGPVGGLVSARGAEPGDLAGAGRLEAAPSGPKRDPPVSQCSFSRREKMISLDLSSFLFRLRDLNLGLTQSSRP